MATKSLKEYVFLCICLRLQVSKESLSTADMYTIDFIEPLVEYSRMLKSITTAINQWASKKKHYNKMMAELVCFIYCIVLNFDYDLLILQLRVCNRRTSQALQVRFCCFRSKSSTEPRTVSLQIS